MPTVTSADGTRIAYEQRGQGPPLVLLHGGLTHRYWDPVVPRLAEAFTVVAPDRRGRGESGDADAYSIQREAADARAVAAAVDGDPVLFGHSFGGRMAVEAAREADVAAVAAYEPAYLVGEYRQRADLAARMRAALADGDRRRAAKLHVEEVLHGGEIDDEEFDAWLETWPGWPAVVEFVENTLRMDRAIERTPMPDDPHLDAPALLLTGSEGPAHLKDSAEALADRLADSRLVEFDGLGHGGPASAPDRVLPEVRSFLEETVGRDPA